MSDTVVYGLKVVGIMFLFFLSWDWAVMATVNRWHPIISALVDVLHMWSIIGLAWMVVSSRTSLDKSNKPLV